MLNCKRYKRIESNFNARFFDDLVPFDHIQDNIKELKDEIYNLEKLISENKDKDFVQLCVSLKVKLCDRTDYFEKKYRNIQHLNKDTETDTFSRYYTDQF